MWITPNQLYNTVGQIKGYVDDHSGGGGITEKVLWTGQADTIGTTYNFSEDISGYDYLYVKGNIFSASYPIVFSEIYKVTDLISEAGEYTGVWRLNLTAFSNSQSTIKSTRLQLNNSTSFKVLSFQNSADDTYPIIPTEIIGWKFNSGSGSGGSTINYSLEEREVGTWIDGSVLYQRTLEADIPVGEEGTPRVISINANINNEPIYMPHIVNGFIQFKSSGSSIIDGSVYCLNSSALSSAAYTPYITNTNIQKQAGEGIYVITTRLAPTLLTQFTGKIYICLQYTKTPPPPSPIIPEKPESLEAATWEEIAAISDAAKAGTINIEDYFSLGDTKSVTLTDERSFNFQLVGFNHDVDENGETIPMSFLSKNCIPPQAGINASHSVNIAGWKSVSNYNYCNTDLFNLFPIDLQNIIKNTSKPCCLNATQNENVVCKIWLPSSSELGVYNSTYQTLTDGTIYNYIATHSNIIKTLDDTSSVATMYWLRSIRTNTNNYQFLCVTTQGISDWLTSQTQSLGICIGFCI